MSRQRTAPKVEPQAGNDRSMRSDDECVQKLAALIDPGTMAISARSRGLLAAMPFPWSNVGRPYRTAKRSSIFQQREVAPYAWVRPDHERWA